MVKHSVLLFVVWRVLLVVRVSVFVACCFLIGDVCLLLCWLCAVGCFLCVARCALFVVRCSLSAVRCMVFVDC